MTATDYVSHDDDRFGSLTIRERDVLDLLATGATNAQIGKTLGLREGTIRNVIARLTRYLGVADRTQLALLAVRNGFGQRNSELECA